MTTRHMTYLVAAAFAGLPSMALAHVGAEGHGSFAAGFGHPLGGADHVLAMVALGIWAAQAGSRHAQGGQGMSATIWAAPSTFVLAMLLGGVVGMAGVVLPMVEPLILASIIVFGVAVALALRVRPVTALSVIALFGAAHGWAHGAEGPAAGLAGYALGFALATAMLHGLGILLGRGLDGLAGRALPRALGGATALVGLALTIGGLGR